MLQQRQNKIEILLHRVGGQNRYQFAIFLVFALKWMIAAMILFSLNFFYITPDFICDDKQNMDYSSCEEFVCSYDDQQFWYNHLQSPKPRSIALDYGVIMVCSKAWIASFLQSVSYIGAFFGYIIMSHVGDNLGRKKGQFMAWLICIGGQLVMIFSVNLLMVGIGSFLLGYGANAAITLHYSFFKELVLGKTRERMIIAIQLAFSLGISLISLLSYLIYEWKYTMAFFILIPSIIAIFAFNLVEETPQFTIKEGYQSLRKSLNRIARFNNNQQLEAQQVADALNSHSFPQKNSQVNFLDLFRYKSLCYITIISGTINFTIQFIFDGTLLSLDKFGFNVYFDQILVGLVQISASIFGAYIIPKVARKYYLTLAFSIISIISAIMGLQSLTYHHQSNEINSHTIVQMLLIGVLRFLISSVWGVFFVFVSQLFPYEVSSLSYGWTSIMGTIGASISPYIRLATANLTMFVMALLSVLNVFLVRTLSETKGKAIPIRIKQREQQQQQLKICQGRNKSIISDQN